MLLSAGVMCSAILAVALVLAARERAPAEGGVDDLPPYVRVEGISGSLKSIGSDTMNNLMTLWSEGFRRFYPNVQFGVKGEGSGSAPPALISGTADLGPMSRPMKNKEIEEFESRFGYKPTGLKSAIDMLAVYVHKDNPIKQLTLQQVDAIFSKTRKGGHAQDIRTWGDLGLKGAWAKKPIALYGRNSTSGTYVYFKEHALFGGDFKDQVKEQPGSSAVVQAVASNKYAIGYSGIGYKTADVRAVPLALGAVEMAYPADAQYAYSQEYPLSRFLYIYVNYQPGSQLAPLPREFVRYVFSREGQQAVIEDGYLPVSRKTAEEALASVGLAY
jgi:phosphate transport system substrate-binding protein